MNPYEANKVAVSIAMLQANLNNSEHAKRHAMLSVINNLQCIACPGSPDEAKKHEVKDERRSIRTDVFGNILPAFPLPISSNSSIDAGLAFNSIVTEHDKEMFLATYTTKPSWFSKLLKRISK